MKKEEDQSELSGYFAPCLKRDCDGRDCKLYRRELWCTVYFCVPVCPMSDDAVVVCERCQTMWLKDQYFQMVHQILERLGAEAHHATTAPDVNQIARAAASDEEAENIQLWSIAIDGNTLVVGKDGQAKVVATTEVAQTAENGNESTIDQDSPPIAKPLEIV